MHNKRILIAGGAGQISRALVYLLQGSNEIHVADLCPSPAVREELQQAGCIVWEKDLVKDSLDDLPAAFDVVFNMIVLWPADTSVTTQKLSLDVNGFASGRLLLRYGKESVFVQGSTGGVYQAGEAPCVEHQTPLDPDGFYHQGKFAAEMMLDLMCRERGDKGVILRYFWPYAPYDRWHGISEQYMQLLAKEPLRLRSRRLCPIYISDVAEKTIAGADHAASPPTVFNITNPQVVTREVMVQYMCELAGLDVPEDIPASDEVIYLGDDTFMSRHLGPARIDWREGIQRMARAFKEDVTRPVDWMFA